MKFEQHVRTRALLRVAVLCLATARVTGFLESLGNYMNAPHGHTSNPYHTPTVQAAPLPHTHAFAERDVHSAWHPQGMHAADAHRASRSSSHSNGKNVGQQLLDKLLHRHEPTAWERFTSMLRPHEPTTWERIFGGGSKESWTAWITGQSADTAALLPRRSALASLRYRIGVSSRVIWLLMTQMLTNGLDVALFCALHRESECVRNVHHITWLAFVQALTCWRSCSCGNKYECTCLELRRRAVSCCVCRASLSVPSTSSWASPPSSLVESAWSAVHSA